MTLSTATTDFVAAQRVNRRNTFLLLAILTLLAASLGYLIGWVLSFDDAAPGPWSGGGVIGAGLMAAASIGWSLISLATSDRMVLGMASAKDIDKADAPQLFNVVEEMSIAAGVPMPRVMVIETDALNAFATGPSVQRGTIVVTRGLLKALNRDELQGVVAHEMAHIANLDTRYMVMVGVTVGLIALVCDMALRTLNWGGSAHNRSSSGNKKDSGGAAMQRPSAPRRVPGRDAAKAPRRAAAKVPHHPIANVPRRAEANLLNGAAAAGQNGNRLALVGIEGEEGLAQQDRRLGIDRIARLGEAIDRDDRRRAFLLDGDLGHQRPCIMRSGV